MTRRRSEDFIRQLSLLPEESSIPQAVRSEQPADESELPIESSEKEENCKLCEAWGPGNCPRHRFEYR